MAQQLDFSEFTFGFALTENFSRSKSLRGVPVFPSLKEEGQKTGGYDVALDDGKGIPDQDDVSIGEMQKRGLTVHEPEGSGVDGRGRLAQPVAPRRNGAGRHLRPRQRRAQRLSRWQVTPVFCSTLRGGCVMRVFLVNPSHVSFGTAVITPRWLYVLAGATPSRYGDPILVDETLDPFDATQLAPGDVVGIGIHTANALRGYEVGQLARARGAYVVFGGIHATLYPNEAHAQGGAHAVVRGDGDVTWATVIDDCAAGTPREVYEAGQIAGATFKPARWDRLPKDRYMWASIQTVRGCPKHCSFCSVWRTDGQTPRQANIHNVLNEAVELRRRGFRFIALADDNFYPVTLTDLAQAARRSDPSQLRSLEAVRAERFALMDGLAKLPDDMVFFTQITMEAAEDPEYLQAMKRARIRGALVGVEAVTPRG